MHQIKFMFDAFIPLWNGFIEVFDARSVDIITYLQMQED